MSCYVIIVIAIFPLFFFKTHVCIQQTALELVGRGLEVHIVADATSSRSMMDRMFALEVTTFGWVCIEAG